MLEQARKRREEADLSVANKLTSMKAAELCAAIEAGDVMKAFEKLDAKTASCPHPDTGRCALHYCIAKASHELLRMVLEARADPDARDSYDQTPLMMAAKQARGKTGMDGGVPSSFAFVPPGDWGLPECLACDGSLVRGIGKRPAYCWTPGQMRLRQIPLAARRRKWSRPDGGEPRRRWRELCARVGFVASMQMMLFAHVYVCPAQHFTVGLPCVTNCLLTGRAPQPCPGVASSRGGESPEKLA